MQACHKLFSRILRLVLAVLMEAGQAQSEISEQASIIIPSRNEENSIVGVLEEILIYLPEAEILVIDASSDQTFLRAKFFSKDWPQVKVFKQMAPKGKGSAIRQGIAKASRAYLAQFDSDHQFCAKDLVSLFEALHTRKADFICGSRFLKKSQRENKSVPGFRSFGNWFVNQYASKLSGFRFTDLLAGIKVWRKEVTESFELLSDDFCYEAELPLKAYRKGFRVIDFPVQTKARVHGMSSVPVLKTGLRLLREIPKFIGSQSIK